MIERLCRNEYQGMKGWIRSVLICWQRPCEQCMDQPAFQGYPSNDSVSATALSDSDLERNSNEGHDSLTSSSSSTSSGSPMTEVQVDIHSASKPQDHGGQLRARKENLVLGALRRASGDSPDFVRKSNGRPRVTRHSCTRRMGLKLNKLWLTSCGIRCRFAEIRTISVGELCLWLAFILIFGRCAFLVGRKLLYGQSNLSHMFGFCIHSGVLTGLFYFLTILLSSRYPFYWKLGLFVIGFDRQIMYHRKCAFMGATCCILHVIDHRDKLQFHWDSTHQHLMSWPVLTGWICFGSALLLLVFSIEYFRRKFYNSLFIKSHWLLVLLFLVFGWLHNAILVKLGTIFIIIDSIIRVLDHRLRSTEVTNIRLLDYDRVIKLEFRKKHFSYRAGQYVLVRFPAVGLMEFHPFSISSHPGSGDTFSLHIKSSVASENGWTARLTKFMKEHEDKPQHWKDISVQIEGPFGELTLRKELSRYEHVVFIGGGIGITPLDSLFNQLVTDLLDNNIRRKAKTRKIDFIFTTRSRSLITEFASRNAAWEFHRASSVKEEDLRNLRNDLHSNDHLTIDVSPPRSVPLPPRTVRLGNAEITGITGHGEDSTVTGSINTEPRESRDHPDPARAKLRTVQTSISWGNINESAIMNALQIPTDPHQNQDSLNLEERDKEVGVGKPKIIRFSSTRSFDISNETFAADLAVDSLQITNSTHITRIKDESLRKEYSATYPFINFERPNIREIIYHAAAATRSKDICVLTSGPMGMINEVKRWALEIGVDVHSEHFEW